jgi:hypothetical protein
MNKSAKRDGRDISPARGVWRAAAVILSLLLVVSWILALRDRTHLPWYVLVPGALGTLLVFAVAITGYLPRGIR